MHSPRRLNVLASLAIALVATAAVGTASAATGNQSASQVSSLHRSPQTLTDKVRKATERYKDLNVTLSEGWVQATPCVSGPDFGAMGVHFVLPSRLSTGVLDAEQPQALIYEPMPDGAMRLVGVEFIVLASVWASHHPNGGPPALEGNLLNLIGAPNRFGLDAFYEMHVWAWEHNPTGSFADWNTHVSCEQQPIA